MSERRVHDLRIKVDAEWCKWAPEEEVKQQIGDMVYNSCKRGEAEKPKGSGTVATITLERWLDSNI